MVRQLRTGLIAFVVISITCGLAYPLLVTGIGQLAFNSKANGSLVERKGVVIGSSLIGQEFASPRYFHPRLSAAGGGYDAMASGGSNLGPTNPELKKDVEAAAKLYRRQNGLSQDAAVPIDAVTTSGSGLDPQISPANARLQAARVAAARGLPLSRVLTLVGQHTQGRGLGFLGDPGVNVLELNLALDRLAQ
jgi:potassium-transporting ATPase KdpC subunit